MSHAEKLHDLARAANASALPHFQAFQGHRQRTTQLILESASESARSLCVLGAGNAYDLELERLLARFQRVHLVDIDAEALARARARVPELLRAGLVTHAPLELSGLFHEAERYLRLEVTPAQLGTAPAAGARRIAGALPAPFDVVASTCLLSQLQLSLLRLLGDSHRPFVVLRELLSLTHLRTLAALTAGDGQALLLNDLCEAAVFPAGRPRGPEDLGPLMAQLVAAGHVVHSSHPGLLALTLRDDPVLSRAFGPARLSEPWLWNNGPKRRYLVYGMGLPRRPT